jgi:hypothetical protein
MAKKQISTYKFVPGAIPPAYGQYPNAVALLAANKTFLIEEMDAYIRQQIAANIAPFVGYNYTTARSNSAKERTSFFIDAIIYDLTYGGNSLTYQVAARYYLSGDIQILTPAIEVATHTWLRGKITTNILLNASYTRINTIETQVILGDNAETAAVTLSTTLANYIINTINTGLSNLPTPVASDTQGGGLLPNAVALLEANKRYIQEEAMALIAYNVANNISPYIYYTYNAEKCRRDISYILEGYISDLKNGGNRQTRSNASKYWENGVAQVDGDRQPEIVAHTFIKNLIQNYILDNIAFTSRQAVVNQTINLAYAAEITADTRISELAGTVIDVITNGVSALPTLISSRGYVKFPGFYKQKDLLLITNTDRNVILYNFADSTTAGELTYSTDFDSDFPGALYGNDKITSVTFDIDTTAMMVTDSIQIFVEGKEQAVRLNPIATDAMERMKVGIPQAMLDADFEYGLQPTKWQAIGLMRGYPAIYEIPNSDIAVTLVQTDASAAVGGTGASLITVTCSSAHGFAVNDPFTIKALANSVSGFSRAEGSFLVNSVSTLTFTYYAKSKVGTTNPETLSSIYTQIRRGGFYTGSAVGVPAFSVFSSGVSGSVTTKLITQSGVDVVGFLAPPPPLGAPLSGVGITSGAQITAINGPGGTAATTTLITTAIAGDTTITVTDTTGISAGLVFDRGDGVAVLVTSVVGNDLTLSSGLTSQIIGTSQTYSGLSQSATSGSGVGAIFDINRNGATYSTTTSSPGTGYVAGNTVTVLGTSLGGATTANDATVTVVTASPFNVVATLDDTTLVQGTGYSAGAGIATQGGGTGAVVDITTDGLGAVNGVTLFAGGTGYTVGDTLTILGTGRVATGSSLVAGTGYTTSSSVATTGGSGTNLTVNIVDNGSGGVASITVSNPGVGYSLSENITITGGNGDASFTIASLHTNATIQVLTVTPGGAIQSVTTAGTPITAPSKDFISAFTMSAVTSAQIADANGGISFSAISTIQVAFPSAHGFIPGDTITTQITSTGAGAQLAAGAYFVEQVPNALTLRYTARAPGAIDNTLTGNLYGRPDSFFIHRPFDGGVQLGTGGPSHGATAIRMSKKYIRYQSGKGVSYNTGALFAPSYDLRSLSASGTAVGSVITVTTDDTDHGCQVGGNITISGVTTSGYNGNYTVSDIITERVFSVIASQSLGATNAVLSGQSQMSVRSWHGSTIRAGIFDDQNGMFWQYDGQRMAVVKRSSTFQIAGTITIAANSNLITGANTRFTQQLAAGDRIVIRGMSHVVSQVSSDTSMTVTPDYRGVTDVTGVKCNKTQDLIVPQENFNLDTLNGSGQSGYNIDVTKMQMIGIQHTWYGAGFIDFMLRGSDGNYVFAHRFRNSNYNTEAYMRSGNQPVRYEVINEGAKDKLSAAMTDSQTTIPLESAYFFPTSGTVMINSELIRFTGNTGTTLTGCTRSATLTQFVAGSQRSFTGGAAAAHAAASGVILVSNTITPNISHWGSAFLLDGQFDSDRGYLFNYAATGVSTSVEKTTAFLIRLAPSVSNAQIGDLGEKELLNRAQFLLSNIAITTDPVSSVDPFTGNTWSASGTATSGLYYSNVSAGVKNWYQATSTGTFSSTAPTFTSGTGASGTYGVNLTWAGATPNNAGAIVVEGVLNPANYPTDPTKITWTGLSSSAAGGQPSFCQVASGGSVTWSGNVSTATPTIQGAFTTTVVARSFAPVTASLTAVGFAAVNRTANAPAVTSVQNATYQFAFQNTRNDFLIPQAVYAAFTTPLAANDIISVSPWVTSSQRISSVTQNYITIGGTVYARIIMTANANFTSGTNTAVNNININSSVAATYNVALSTARTDFLVASATGSSVTDVLTAANLSSGQGIATITPAYTTIAGTSYTRIVMTSGATTSSTAGANVAVTATSSATATYGRALSTARTDFLMTNADFAASGIAVGDTLSLATFITGGQTISTITQSYITIGATTYTRIVMSAVANSSSTSGSGNDQTVTVTAAGSGSTYVLKNFLFFTSSTWEASGATISTKVASDQTAFPAGTSVASVSTRTFGATTVYRVTFTQSSNATITSGGTLKFQFGSFFALPGEQVFSFISNPGESNRLDLTELKELTATAIGGRGAFPNGPDVLAINVFKVSGGPVPASIILRWAEAQA